MTDATRSRLGWTVILITMILIIMGICSIVTAYCFAFSRMSANDDEGTLMTVTRDFLAGQALYDRVPTIYGPLFYSYQREVHSLLGISVTNDSVRFITVFFWVGAAGLIFLLVCKATASAPIAAAASLLAFRQLGFLSGNPSHPQELCIVLLVGLILAACSRGSRSWMMILLGALAAGMLLTKINLGIFAIASLALVFTYATKPDPLSRTARIVVALVALALPASLMSGLLGRSWVLKFTALEVLSILAAILVLSRMNLQLRLGLREFLLAGLGFSLSLVAISSFVLLRGSSIAAMVNCLIVTPRKVFGPEWNSPTPIWTAAIPWAILCVLLAWYASREPLQPAIVVSLKLSLAGFVVLSCVAERHDLLMSFIPPMLWLIALPGAETHKPRLGEFPRAILLLVSVIGFLYTYPISGTPQMKLSEVLVIVVAAVCFADALPYTYEILRPLLPARLLAGDRTAAVALVVLLAGWGAGAWQAVRQYRSYKPLDLQGASYLRLEPEKAAALRELVTLSRRYSCNTLVTAPGMPSFNFWTGLHSPQQLGGGCWVSGMNNAEQEILANQLSKEPHVCVIFNQDRVEYCARGRVPSTPMVRFILDQFRTEFQSGDYQLRVRD